MLEAAGGVTSITSEIAFEEFDCALPDAVAFAVIVCVPSLRFELGVYCHLPVLSAVIGVPNVVPPSNNWIEAPATLVPIIVGFWFFVMLSVADVPVSEVLSFKPPTMGVADCPLFTVTVAELPPETGNELLLSPVPPESLMFVLLARSSLTPPVPVTALDVTVQVASGVTPLAAEALASVAVALPEVVVTAKLLVETPLTG